MKVIYLLEEESKLSYNERAENCIAFMYGNNELSAYINRECDDTIIGRLWLVRIDPMNNDHKYVCYIKVNDIPKEVFCNLMLTYVGDQYIDLVNDLSDNVVILTGPLC